MTTGNEGFEILDPATCLELLGTVEIGRLAWADSDGRVQIRPVNFSLAGSDMIIRVRSGSILATARANLPVTFEADDLEPGWEVGWSVLVLGTIEDLGSTPEAAQLGESVHSWARGDRPNVLRIRAGEVTGRRVRPHEGEIIVVRLDPDGEE